MKRLFLLFLPVFFLISSPEYLRAFEIEFTGGVNFLNYLAPGRPVIPDPTFNQLGKISFDLDAGEDGEDGEGEGGNGGGEIEDEGKFSPFILGNLSIKGEISNSSAFHVNIGRDNIQQNSINFRLNTRMDNFRFEFGPFIGISDKFDLDIGLLGSLEVTFPGIVFFSLSGSSTIGRMYSFTSDNSRESVEIKLGFWLPIVIPTLSFNIKSFTHDDITDSLTRIQFSAEFFGKTSPVTIRIDAGYEILECTADDYYSKTINAFFTGFEFNLKIAQARIIAGGEIPFILPSNNSDILFKTYAGFAYSFY